MKKTIFLIAILLIAQYSCITDQDKYKESDIFEEYEAENGFTILHLPPVLFKIILSVSDESGVDSKELLDKIEVIKFMFFEEKDKSIKIGDLKSSMNQKLEEFNYNLLTRFAEENNDISIYIIENEKIIYEVLVTIISDEEYISLNLVGNLTQDEIMKVYKSINMQKIHDYGN
ncbi:MAG: DUF4252 domain-containing protein [Bacteroidales bacterium]|nr:DUF4252 domain-containing protein [Bacteroidales bacterium]